MPSVSKTRNLFEWQPPQAVVIRQHFIDRTTDMQGRPLVVVTFSAHCGTCDIEGPIEPTRADALDALPCPHGASRSR